MTTNPRHRVHPPRLAAGVHVLRRGDGYVQVGLGREHAAVLPETPEVQHALHLLVRAAGTDADLPDELRPLLHVPPEPVTGNVAVNGFGHASGEPLRRKLRSLLRSTGLTVGRGRVGLTIVLGVGEPSRLEIDKLTRRGKPHLFIRYVEGTAIVGPLVVPGKTACLRCLDADAADTDPSWPLLVEQYAAASSQDRIDGMTEPIDPIVADLALSWAARDVLTFFEGGQASSLSATLRFTRSLRDVEAAQWSPHPACGCAWRMAP